MNVSRCLNTEWVRFAACAARSSGCSDCQTCRRCPAPNAALIKVSQRVSDRGDAVPPDLRNAKTCQSVHLDGRDCHRGLVVARGRGPDAAVTARSRREALLLVLCAVPWLSLI